MLAGNYSLKSWVLKDYIGEGLDGFRSRNLLRNVRSVFCASDFYCNHLREIKFASAINSFVEVVAPYIVNYDRTRLLAVDHRGSAEKPDSVASNSECSRRGATWPTLGDIRTTDFQQDGIPPPQRTAGWRREKRRTLRFESSAPQTEELSNGP